MGCCVVSSCWNVLYSRERISGAFVAMFAPTSLLRRCLYFCMIVLKFSGIVVAFCLFLEPFVPCEEYAFGVECSCFFFDAFAELVE